MWWALAHAARFAAEPGMASAAAKLFDATIGSAARIESPRSLANTLFGLYHRRKTVECPGHLALIHDLAGRLATLYEGASDVEWRWFEPYLTYCNSSLPASLLLAH